MSATAAGRSAGARRSPIEVQVVTTGLAIVAVATGFRVWSISKAWFFYDDFYFLQKATTHDLTLSYLLEPYNGHLMPLGFLATWLNAHAAVLDFSYPAAELVVGFALTGLAVLRLLVSMFGARPAVLVPLVMFCFSPILLPATTWWAAGVNQVPMLLFEVLALHAFLRYLRTPTWRPLAANLLWLVIGLGFVERTLLVLGVLWLLALLYFTTGNAAERVRMVWQRYRAAVLAHVVLVAGYLGAYIPWALNFDARTVVRRPFFEVVRDLAGTAFGSGVVGGPMHWEISRVTQAEAHPGQLFLVLAWAVIVTVVVASARTRVRGLRAWLLPGYSLAASIGLLAVSRVIYFGPEIGLDYRFQTETALLAPIALGLAFLPLRGAVESSALPEQPTTQWRIDTPGWSVCGVIAVVVLAAISTASFPLRNLGDRSPQRYYARAAASLAKHPDVDLLDRTVPPWLWAPLAYPTNTYRHMLALIPQSRGRIVTTTSDQSYALDDSGEIRPVVLIPARAAKRPQPDQICLRNLDSAEYANVQLDGPVAGVGWYVVVTYNAGGPGSLRITIDGHDRWVDVHEGIHTVLAPTAGDYSSVLLYLSANADPVCVGNVQVGQIAVDAKGKVS